MHFKQTSEGIDYLYDYYPVGCEEHGEDSRAILRFKEGKEAEIERFANEIKEALISKAGNNQSFYKDVVVVIVPSHRCGEWSESLKRVAVTICKELDMLNYSSGLKRIMNHAKLSTGGDRSKESHLKTIAFGKRDIVGKRVLILDDVTTTGNSIRACAEILKKAGAVKVGAVAIGKTTRNRQMFGKTENT